VASKSQICLLCRLSLGTINQNANGMPGPEDKKDRPETGQSDPASAGASPEAKKLTPEEQMAAFEEELKETDWGHQPC